MKRSAAACLRRATLGLIPGRWFGVGCGVAALALLCVPVAAADDAPADSEPVIGVVDPDRAAHDVRPVAADAITIDASDAEAAWEHANRLDEFLTLRPVHVPVKWPTQVRLLWDEDRLYVFVEARVRQPVIVGDARDAGIWNAETVGLYLAPHGPQPPYYEIAVNPEGVIFDTRAEDWRYDVAVVHQWDWAHGFNGEVEAATALERDTEGEVVGWRLEMAIEIDSLGLPEELRPAAGGVWHFNATRIAAPGGEEIEYSLWAPTERDFHRPYQFPELRFVGPREAVKAEAAETSEAG